MLETAVHLSDSSLPFTVRTPMNISLYIWTFLAMLQHAPIEHLPDFEGHVETQTEALARYGAIAQVIVEVCDAESKAPKNCVALLVALGIGESHFAKDADIGPCHRKGGFKGRCDGGLAASVWQTHAYGHDKNGKQITVERLFAERRLAAEVALRQARSSIRACAHLPRRNQLAGLAGRCDPSPQHMKSAQSRYDGWQALLTWTWKVTP